MENVNVSKHFNIHFDLSEFLNAATVPVPGYIQILLQKVYQSHMFMHTRKIVNHKMHFRIFDGQ